MIHVAGKSRARVLIDDRAGSEDLILKPCLRSIAELGRLNFGDVMIAGNGPDGNVAVGIEVKSIWDLVSSAANGRLMDTQIAGMLGNYSHCWLLVYGNWRAGRKDGLLHIQRSKDRWEMFKLGKACLPYSFLEHLFTEITMMGVHVATVPSEYDAAEWIAAMASWWGKKWGDHKASRTFDRSSAEAKLRPVALDPRVRSRAEIASKLPGVGFERAIAAAKHFKSVREMMNAPMSEWLKVPGIGKGIAKSVATFLEG